MIVPLIACPEFEITFIQQPVIIIGHFQQKLTIENNYVAAETLILLLLIVGRSLVHLGKGND